jgi:hypothetical protein
MSKVNLVEINFPHLYHQEPDLRKDLYILLLDALRMPPHIGIILQNKYHSLTLKGSEPDVDTSVLLRTIQQKKTECIFLKIKPHPVYSLDYLSGILREILKKYPEIKAGETTCLSPVSDFFEEFYAVQKIESDIVFSFLNKLNANGFILEAYLVNLTSNSNGVSIPFYDAEDLKQTIQKALQQKQHVY